MKRLKERMRRRKQNTRANKKKYMEQKRKKENDKRRCMEIMKRDKGGGPRIILQSMGHRTGLKIQFSFGECGFDSLLRHHVFPEKS